MNWRAICFVGILSFLVVGCGGVKYGQVSGKVSYKKGALPGGTVHFWPQESAGNPAGATIKEDGSYTAMVPVGDSAVTVETESVSGKGKTWLESQVQRNKGKRGGGGISQEMLDQIKANAEASGNKLPEPEKGNYVRINQSYSNPNTSGLKTNVHTGEQEYNIDLR
jgi:hypothetical protein